MGLGTPAQIGGTGRARRGYVRLRAADPRRPQRHGLHRAGARSASRPASTRRISGPIEEGCECYACRNFTRAYLRHLLNVNEILGLRMVSVHNSHMYMKLMTDIRAAIAAGSFGEFRREFVANFVPSRKILRAREESR